MQRSQPSGRRGWYDGLIGFKPGQLNALQTQCASTQHTLIHAVSWSIFIIFISLETGMNALQRRYKMYDFTLCLHTINETEKKTQKQPTTSCTALCRASCVVTFTESR